MRHHLVFMLAAPLASFGTVAVGERRPTWDRPSKSQVTGLVAAALGIERTEEARLKALAGALGFAVRVDAAGWLAVDYHTAEAPKDASLRRRAREMGPVMTRADELACDDRKTILSRREFRTGSLHTVALWRTAEGDPALADIAERLSAPTFVPYAGRKAHVLMLPMSPRLVAADRIEEAFECYDQGEPKEATDLLERLGIRRDKDRPICLGYSSRGAGP